MGEINTKELDVTPFSYVLLARRLGLLGDDGVASLLTGVSCIRKWKCLRREDLWKATGSTTMIPLRDYGSWQSRLRQLHNYSGIAVDTCCSMNRTSSLPIVWSKQVFHRFLHLQVLSSVLDLRIPPFVFDSLFSWLRGNLT